MDETTAAQVERLGRSANAALNEALIVAQANCTADEFVALRSVVGRIMGTIVIELLQPLYAEHPGITPPELRD